MENLISPDSDLTTALGPEYARYIKIQDMNSYTI